MIQQTSKTSQDNRPGQVPPLGLYIHIPFCETKCGYCDFFSVALKDRNTAPLVDAVIRELGSRLARTRVPVRTIFCGGGTPTLLPIDQLRRLLDALRRTVDPSRDRQGAIFPSVNDNRFVTGGGRTHHTANATLGVEEFTVEANPATVDDDKAELLVASGVTRVSMGAQSFFPAELATLERLHSPDDIGPSVHILRRHGVGQVNLDLIFGIPGQTLDTWRESLQRAIDLGPDHIACYGLTFEPATRLTALRNAGRVTPCDEDLEADMFLLTIDVLESAGFKQYEISNYAKPGCECRHNLIYWRNQPYIGVGPSAAGCYEARDQGDCRVDAAGVKEGGAGILNAEQPRLRRYKNVPDVAEYTCRLTPAALTDESPAAPSGLTLAEIEAEFVEGDTLSLELILMQLRLNEGLSIADFATRTGVDPLRIFEPSLSRLVEQGSVEVNERSISLTQAGRLIGNRVIDELASCVGQKSLALTIL